jgi:hypothetical protein
MRQKCRKRFPVYVLTILIPVLLGMGSVGDTGTPGRIPVPDKKFTAVVIDQMDVATETRDISIEGGTFLEGKKGEGTFTVGFENIKFVNFLMSDGKLFGHAQLKDGKMVQLSLNKSKKLFGKTPYGTFQIPLGDLKKITITSPGK